MNSITIELPLPHKGLTPNRRAQGGQYYKLKKAAREAGYLCAFAALKRRDAPQWEQARALIVRYGPNRMHPDGDNVVASLKHYIDGIADCGIIRNDRGLKTDPPILEVDKDNPRIEITITPVSKEAGIEADHPPAGVCDDQAVSGRRRKRGA